MLPIRMEKIEPRRLRAEAGGSKGVIVVQAQLSHPADRPVSFLLSSIQVEEILSEVRIWPVPFSDRSAEGIAMWRDQLLPIVSLEKRLGFELMYTDSDRRFIVVQTRQSDTREKRRGMIAVNPHIRSSTLPADTHPAEDCSWLPDASAVLGVYEWHQELLIVADLEMIFNQVPSVPASPARAHPLMIERKHVS